MTLGSRDRLRTVLWWCAVTTLAASVALAASVRAGAQVAPPPIGPVLTVATGPGWRMAAWSSPTRGLCAAASHQTRTSTFCIGDLLRDHAMLTAISGRTTRFVVSGVVTTVVRKLVVTDAVSKRTVLLYAAPAALITPLRFFRAVVRPRGANPSGIRWKLTAFDGQGRVVSFTGQGRNVR